MENKDIYGFLVEILFGFIDFGLLYETLKIMRNMYAYHTVPLMPVVPPENMLPIGPGHPLMPLVAPEIDDKSETWVPVENTPEIPINVPTGNTEFSYFSPLKTINTGGVYGNLDLQSLGDSYSKAQTYIWRIINDFDFKSANGYSKIHPNALSRASDIVISRYEELPPIRQATRFRIYAILWFYKDFDRQAGRNILYLYNVFPVIQYYVKSKSDRYY